MRADRKLEVSDGHSLEERNLTEALPMAVVDPASPFFFVVLTVMTSKVRSVTTMPATKAYPRNRRIGSQWTTKPQATKPAKLARKTSLRLRLIL
jgi:hypothetical protein